MKYESWEVHQNFEPEDVADEGAEFIIYNAGSGAMSGSWMTIGRVLIDDKYGPGWRIAWSSDATIVGQLQRHPDTRDWLFFGPDEPAELAEIVIPLLVTRAG